jgi:3-methyl-2-oxobutanoate hydroxymethyltransferase
VLVGDMPFMTFQISPEEALRNAARLMTEGQVGAVKIEGGVDVAPTVERLVRAGIPVCGHLGFTPQSAHTLGGPRIQARDPAAAMSLIADAKALESAGAFRCCVGARSGGGCCADQSADFDPYDRYWLRPPLRW